MHAGLFLGNKYAAYPGVDRRWQDTRLESLERSHAIELFIILRDLRIYEFIDGRPPSSLKALKARCTILQAVSLLIGEQTAQLGSWSVSDEKFIGYVQATVDPKQGVAENAYVIAPTHWDTKLAFRAVQRCCWS